ncbi:transglycosylase domain-containing protein [Saccharothrix sp. BKS2]|uniref:transglycosylase domain-containing protein n=1 Tax=Saccharothrix sp. BKS2 TaxID=3064400 RepID=UPI0039EAB1AB
MLVPVHQSLPREPELLTHREDEVELEPFYDEDGYDYELTEAEAKAVRRKKLWRRVRRTTYVALGLMLLAPVVAFAIAYQVVEVPNPEQVAADQSKVISIRYADGSEMARIALGEANRTLVKYEDLPDSIKNAVFAAEDPTFETNLGFDMRAIARAVWYQATGRESGGSGLTQQYVKEATDQSDATLARKFNEMVAAYKMSEQQDKHDILTAYLNTVYFGRGAYGVKTAAKAYFGVDDLQQVTPAQAAVLAGMIQSPSRSEDLPYVEERWNYVMNQMLRFNWIDSTYRETEKVPERISLTEQSGLSGPRLHIRDQVLEEMARVGWDQEKVQKIGVTVHTTIDPKMQQSAEDAVNQVLDGQPEDLKTSLSAVDPTSGAVRAYYAGEDGAGQDYARETLQEAGSSFKPFDLVAALQAGKGLGSTYDGRSPKSFDIGTDKPLVIRNASDRGNSCGEQCPVRKAMEMSLNTVFYEMVLEIGTQPVADAAFEAGIPKTVNVYGEERKLLSNETGGPPNIGIALGGGEAQVRPFDMASAYATFAARGVYHEPFFVSKITKDDGEAIYQHVDVSRVAFDADPTKSQNIADNVTEALRPVLKYSRLECAGGRECAGKTGTHELPDDAGQNSKAWMVGYTPTLSASVWMGKNEGNKALQDARGNPIFGGGLPGQIWKKFMDNALAGSESGRFPKAKPMGQYDNPRPVVTTTNPSTNPSENPDRSRDRTTTQETTTTPPTTTTRPPRPCTGLVCPTTPTAPTTSDENDPDPGPGNNVRPPGGG